MSTWAVFASHSVFVEELAVFLAFVCREITLRHD